MKRVMIVVTHLLGTGHLARALVLGRAFVAVGHNVTVVSGGTPVPHLDNSGIDLVQLPALRSDGVNFARLMDAQGNDASDALFAQRTQILMETLESVAPDVLITELYPFGRRILRNEFKALLGAAQTRPSPPLICASIRDILAPPSKPSKADAAHEVLATYYDAVLVHSDPSIAPLSASWPVIPALEDILYYTGYVANPPAEDHPLCLGAGEIVVTAGGGDVGARLFDVALQAAALDTGRRWRLLVGGSNTASTIASLKRRAPANAIVEPARPEFRQMLRHAAASVSMCGYNTALDILQAGTPAVFVPFDAGQEVEQTLRANAMAKLDGVAVISSAELRPDHVLRKVDAVLEAPQRPVADEMRGAARSVEIVEGLLK